jgi:cyclophilin family peptidyl-prolyl cis-trans isomerase
MIKLFVLAFSALLIAGCDPKEVSSNGMAAGDSTQGTMTSESTSTPSESTATSEPEAAPSDYSIPYPDRKPKNGEEVGVFDTEKGKIVFMFFPDKAPKHVAQMKKLLKDGFYTGTRFHRCMNNFMIQGGDPKSKDIAMAGMWGQSGYVENGKEVNIPAEFNDIKHLRGVCSAARSQDPNSASSQFFMMHAASSGLDGQYSAWGQVLSGMDAVDKIVLTGDPNPQANGAVEPSAAIVIKKASLEKWPVK